MKTLDEMLDVVERGAHRIVEARPRQLPQIMHGFREVGPDVLVDVAYDGDLQKQLALARVRSIFREHGVKAYAAMAEAWMVQGSTDEPVDTSVRPSQSPRRREVVILSATDGMGAKGRLLGIERDSRGRIRRLVEDPSLAMSDDVQLAGRMLDLLNPEA
jgi:hypothetical protein